MKTGTDVSLAADLLRQGKIVAIPTETVYGLAANAFDPDAVIRIFEIKNRPRFNPLIVHVPDWDMLMEIALVSDPVLKQVAEKFWPGPLTILAPKTNKIHPVITAGSNLAAVRIPNHELTLRLLKTLNFPLAAPSANLFGKISPTTAAHVEQQLGSKIDYILDGGECSVGVESTIIKVDSGGKIVILRPGGVSAEDIAEVTGYVPALVRAADQPEAPGMLRSHYAPKIPLIVGGVEDLIALNSGKKISLISFTRSYDHPEVLKVYTLSPGGDIHEAARNLFSAMHEAENSGADLIIAEQFPNHGIGMAINDRLKRASS
ncbi:MAG: L-threonylcarbamoyladenylate synthase [Chitinophagales bacterium]